MAQLTTGIRKILTRPWVYDLFQEAVGAGRLRKKYVASSVQPIPGVKILDIGCGTSEILRFLPESVVYVGYDLSADYIRSARSRYGCRGEWHCSPVSDMHVDDFGTFDIVMANGVFHHLDDQDAMRLAEIAARALKVSGRFCSFDGCFTKDQGRIARYIIAKDRGQNVRKPEGYLALVRPYFSTCDISVRRDLLRIPYTHAIIVATKDSPG
ncbi:class I SAM-dependent methyltransferase [Thiocapsa marina]|uniref:Methyltransferase type 12 n=1 Tax=Thiocapsa marina 5811 TaxID=768671 RepID=F9U989_9GAMM|nr:class I SAM-dependent methyltransferase [Thiocapsa marina]EGV19347.1 Methyltransferase type 12 [Thiocapsa marina 5811]